MIGTTDVEYKGDPRKVAITDAERDYLISIVNKHFMREIARQTSLLNSVVYATV